MIITYRLLGRNGRLGNQLWQIASTIGIAARRDAVAAFPYWRYRDYFSVPGEHFPDLAGVTGEDLGSDWLQEVRHLDGVEERIRRFFAPSAQTWERVARRHRNLLDLPVKTALHVRRGDYVELADRFAVLDRSYYDAATSMTDPPYVVFSDDIPWCQDRFRGSDYIFVRHNRDYEDLFLMASCDAVITANSTFSWWGAWLSQGRRIFPRRWFMPGHIDHPVLGRVVESGMFPPNAEVIDS